MHWKLLLEAGSKEPIMVDITKAHTMRVMTVGVDTNNHVFFEYVAKGEDRLAYTPHPYATRDGALEEMYRMSVVLNRGGTLPVHAEPAFPIPTHPKADNE